jgi:hypothetical protein
MYKRRLQEQQQQKKREKQRNTEICIGTCTAREHSTHALQQRENGQPCAHAATAVDRDDDSSSGSTKSLIANGARK